MAKGVGDVLYSILSNDTNISGIVGTKIYPFLAIEDVVYPYIVYTIEGVDPTQTDDGVSILDVNSANIEIYSEDLSENETLSKYVRNALDRYKGTVEGIEVQSISFRSENGGYADADRVYLKIQDYSLRMVTASCMFGRVTDLSSSTVSASQINLSWTDIATGETGWQIWTSQDFINWSLVDTIAADSTSYSVTGLDSQTSYSYKIRAIDSTDNGEWSNIVVGCTETIVVVKSGINYKRPQPTFQNVSYAVYDDKWQLENGAYNYNYPSNPLYTQRLDLATDSSGGTLFYDNAFGNKIRFTDVSGVATPDLNAQYCIDNLTGLMHYFTVSIAPSYNTAFGVGGVLEDYNTNSQGGYNDWYYADINTIIGLTTYGNANQFTLPYLRTLGSTVASSTTDHDGALSNYRFNYTLGCQNSNKTFNSYYLLTRKHF